jgi:hypothetical protein
MARYRRVVKTERVRPEKRKHERTSEARHRDRQKQTRKSQGGARG